MDNFFAWFEKLANIIVDMIKKTKTWFENADFEGAKNEF